MEIDDQELIIEAQEEIEHEEEIVQNEADIEPQEIEIHSEDQNDNMEETPEEKYKLPPTIPPLRPLNIAPKPEQVPIAVKSINGAPIILVPGSGTNQAIKLVNQQGQEINLANYSINRHISIKPAGKTISTSLGHAKQIVMKKIYTNSGPKPLTKSLSITKPGQQFVVVQKTSEQPQHVKLVQTSSGNNLATAPIQSKAITLQQAQEMGLISNPKVIQTTGQQTGSKKTLLINKNPTKTIKFVQQSSTTPLSPTNSKTISITQLKSPTKILPATNISAAKGPQRFILKGSGGQILPAGQLIQVAGTQGITGNQIHQINVPGKGTQYIKLIAATSAEQTASTVTVLNTMKNSTNSVVATSSAADVKSVLNTNKLIAKPLSANSKPAQVIMVTGGYIPANLSQVSKVAIPAIKHSSSQVRQTSLASSVPKPTTPVTSPTLENNTSPTAATPATNNDNTQNANGIRPRKPCNCTKSQCLKLYCDCFANGEFCYLCNCLNCFNNLENEETRNMAIKACLERNPNAFRPKIGKAKDNTGDVLRKHTKGCNCKRSGCLKNYCECYEAKIACSSNCKCVSCRNVEDTVEKKTLETTSSTQRINDQMLVQKVYGTFLPYHDPEFVSPNRTKRFTNSRKQTISCINDDVIEATCQCMLTVSEQAYITMQDEELTKRQIIEEFGECLTEIIQSSLNRNFS
ncbi:protein lin-54 homolog isoform X2 [Rhynchophorus ferrugineus]